MNSTLQLKGVREQINVTRSEAINIKKIWEDNSVPFDFKLTVGHYTFPKSDIKLIIEQSDTGRKESMEEDHRLFYENERKSHDTLAKQSPEQKAHMLGMFEGFYKIATTEEPTQEIIERAYEVQLDFFKKHPLRTLCDAHILKSLIPGLVHESNDGKVPNSASLFRESYFNLMEKAIFRDMQLAGHFLVKENIRPLKEATEEESIEDMHDRVQYNRHIDDEFNSFVKEAVAAF